MDYLDTGAMYRAVAFAALRRGIDPDDAELVARLADQLELEVADTGHGRRGRRHHRDPGPGGDPGGVDRGRQPGGAQGAQPAPAASGPRPARAG